MASTPQGVAIEAFNKNGVDRSDVVEECNKNLWIESQGFGT